MAPRKTVVRWFTDRLCTPAHFVQPQPRSSGIASCPQTRIRTVYVGVCYLTDGLGAVGAVGVGDMEVPSCGISFFVACFLTSIYVQTICCTERKPLCLKMSI